MKTETALAAVGRRGNRRSLAWLAGGAILATLLAGCSTVSNISAENRALHQRELGIAAFNRGEYDEAKVRFQNALDAKPTDFRQHYWMGATELKLSRPVVAQTKFEYAWTLRQEDSEWTPKILDGIAESMFQQDLRDELVTFLGETSTRYGKTADYLREARYLVKIGDPDNAIVAYRKGVRLSTDGDPEPYIAIADFYESINDIPNAVTSLRYAYYLDPDSEAIADRFRQFGIVPGPTLKLEPPKPEMLN